MAQGLNSTQRPLRLLSLDGGGVRGLASLLIIKELMEMIKDENDPNPHPCRYFDMIAGTSTGGLIAIMLGRLRMGIDECITAYLEIGRVIFVTERFPWALKLVAKKRVEEKEEAVQIVLKRLLQPLPSPLNQDTFASSPHSCRCVVVAIHDQRGCKTPYLFRSYDHPPSQSFDPFERNPGSKAAIPIWKVARATSASSTYFPPITIEGKEFFDKGTTFQNPALDAFLEAQQMGGNNRGAVALTISVGAGIANRSRKRRTIRSPCGKDIVDKCMVQSETTNRIVEELCQKKATRYFRFDVDNLDNINLDDWSSNDSSCGFKKNPNSIHRIYQLTRLYLNRKDVRQQVEDAADAIKENDYLELVALVDDSHQGTRAGKGIEGCGSTGNKNDTTPQVNGYVDTLLVTNSPLDDITM